MIFSILNAQGVDFLIYLLIVFVAVVISMSLHEFAHGLVALWNGDPTAKFNGRLTLNPIKHFSLPGFIMLMTVGFGYAKPVPVNPYNFRHQKKGILTVSIAGVSANLILALLSWLFYFLCTFGFHIAFVYYLGEFFAYMIQLNLVLIFFNLLPIYPLDGFHVIEAFTYHDNKFCKFMIQYGMMILLTFMVLSFVSSILVKYTGIAWFEYLDVLGLYLNNTAGRLAMLMIKVCLLA